MLRPGMCPLGRAVRTPGRVYPTYGSGRRTLEGTSIEPMLILFGERPLVYCI
jgi:hypothetical protein